MVLVKVGSSNIRHKKLKININQTNNNFLRENNFSLLIIVEIQEVQYERYEN